MLFNHMLLGIRPVSVSRTKKLSDLFASILVQFRIDDSAWGKPKQNRIPSGAFSREGARLSSTTPPHPVPCTQQYSRLQIKVRAPVPQFLLLHLPLRTKHMIPEVHLLGGK